MIKIKNYILPIFFASILMAAGCASSQGAGVMKTASGGVDWQYANKLGGDTAGSIAGLNISKLDYSPIDDAVFYAGAYNSGLYKSADGAESWEQVLSQIPVYDFALHPSDSNIIYVSGLYDGRGRVLVTRDGGASWNEVFSDANTGYAVRSIALNPSNPQELIIGSDRGTIIKSSDAGASWKLVQTYNDRINKIYWRFDGVYTVIRNSGVYRSTDSGETYQIITNSLEVPNAFSNLAIFGNAVSGYNQLAFSPYNSSLIYMTTDNGLYKTENGGSNWTYVSMPFAKDSVPPSAVALSPTSDNVIYTSAGSIIYKTVDGGQSWTVADTKSGFRVNSLLVNSQVSQVAYAGLSTSNN